MPVLEPYVSQLRGVYPPIILSNYVLIITNVLGI
jgi:hypothetical protein